MPPDAPLPNSTEARTETGELKDQANLSTNTDGQSSDPASTTTQTTGDTSKSTEERPKESDKSSDKSLLNQDGKKADDKTAKAEGAPEKYEAWKVPEGFELAEGLAPKIDTLFRELNLSQDAGQRLVDFYAENLREAQERPFQVWQDQQKAWQDKIKQDPEIGGKLDHVRATVSKAVDALGPELAQPFREAMDYTGAGNNPAFIRALYALAQKVTEPGPVRGRGPVQVTSPDGRPPSAAAAIFPNLAKG